MVYIRSFVRRILVSPLVIRVSALFLVLVVLLVGFSGGAGSAGAVSGGAEHAAAASCTDAEYTVAASHLKSCGAVLHGPSSLRVTPCKQIRGYFCSAPFRFSVSVGGCTDEADCTPSESFYVAETTSGKLISPAGGASMSPGNYWGPSATVSAPQELYVPDSMPARFVFVVWVSGLGGAAHDSEWVGVARIPVISQRSPLGSFDLSGKIVAVACGADSSSCTVPKTPVSGVTVRATGDGSGSATTDDQGAYSMTLPAGTYTVTPSQEGHVFTPPSTTVNLESGDATANFTTCAETENKTTMQRGTAAIAAAKTLRFRGTSPSRNSNVFFKVTPCGDSATVKGSWAYVPECEVPGFSDWLLRAHHGKDVFKGGKEIEFGPEKLTNGKFHLLVDGNVVLTFALPKSSEIATVTISGESMLQTGLPNDITPNQATKMDCRPVSETFTVQGK
jgi:hypothetical protein